MTEGSNTAGGDAFASIEERHAARQRGLFAGIAVVSVAASLVALGIGTGRSARSAASALDAEAAKATVEQFPVSLLSAADDDQEVEAQAAPAVDPGGGPASDSAGQRFFDGRPIRPARTIRMKVTAYSPDERSCGSSADGITASGHSVLTNGGFLVAADPKVLALGSLVSVPGYDGAAVVPVLDVGGAIKGNALDVLFPTHAEARRWGVQHLEVTVWEYADGRGSEFKRVRRKPREE